MPFTLSGVSMDDDYEGDFISRRSIIYTLTFETRVKYYGPLDGESSIIRETKANLSDPDMTSSGEPFSSQNLTISPTDAGESDDFSVNVSFDPKVYESAILSYDTEPTGAFESGESVIGQTSGAVAAVSEIEGDAIRIAVPDAKFEIGETVIGQSSDSTFIISDIEPIWNTLS